MSGRGLLHRRFVGCHAVTAMIQLLHSTRFKLRVAGLAYQSLRRLGLERHRIARRGGVVFDLDLAEGIDLAIFLFGRFQPHVTASPAFSLPPGATIFDVGANVGSICLPLLARDPAACVHAFEPSEHAWRRLQRNLALNPALAERLTAVHAFVGERPSECSELVAYSSWRVDDLEAGERHPVHLGTRHAATRKQISLDAYVEAEAIDRVDFVKIDTDGNELAVLRGARRLLERLRPIVVFELSTHLLAERGLDFGDYLAVFEAADYRLVNSADGRALDRRDLDAVVPRAGSADIAALPG